MGDFRKFCTAYLRQINPIPVSKFSIAIDYSIQDDTLSRPVTMAIIFILIFCCSEVINIVAAIIGF